MNRFLLTLGNPAVLVSVTVLAVLASGIRILSGPGAAYAEIFPPVSLAVVAAAMVVVLLLLERREMFVASRACTWASAIVFFGASGGFVLDVFRAFFAITGLPAGEFAVVDVPGALSRGASLLAALTVILHGQGAIAQTSAPSDLRRRLLGWGGLVFALPYPILKLVWWAQGEDGGHDVGFPVGELLLFGAAAVWIALLVQPRRSNARSWLLVVGGLVGASALLSMGGLMVFGLVFQATNASVPVRLEAEGSTVLGVYSTWLALGAVMLGATLTAMESIMGVRSGRQAVRV